MRTDTFWDVVEAARAQVTDPVREPERVAEALVEQLVTLPADEIVAFQLVLDELLRASYRWDLWAAAFLVNGGCSDDGFDYFRGWLVAQGRTVWEAALADPDSLAELVTAGRPEIAECEELLEAAAGAFARVTGRDEEAFFDLIDEREPALSDLPASPAGPGEGGPGDAGPDQGGPGEGGGWPLPGLDPSGEEFDFDDAGELAARLPRLSALYLPQEG